jgi:hypothetical protein
MMYPVLLDDQSLANQFQMFIETIDESYEVSLSTNQQYPVSYFFLFVNAITLLECLSQSLVYLVSPEIDKEL